MKSLVVILLAALFTFSGVFAADPDIGEKWEFGNYKYCVYDNIEMQIDDNDVVITSSHSRYDDEVRITGKYKLYINVAARWWKLMGSRLTYSHRV